MQTRRCVTRAIVENRRIGRYSYLSFGLTTPRSRDNDNRHLTRALLRVSLVLALVRLAIALVDVLLLVLARRLYIDRLEADL